MLSSCSVLLRNASRKFIHPSGGIVVAGNNVVASGLRADMQHSNVGQQQQQQQQRSINTSKAKHPDVLTKSKASIVSPADMNGFGGVGAGGVGSQSAAERFPFTEPVRFEQRMKKLTR